jgi:hypothetical protein
MPVQYGKAAKPAPKKKLSFIERVFAQVFGKGEDSHQSTKLVSVRDLQETLTALETGPKDLKVDDFGDPLPEPETEEVEESEQPTS